MEASSPPPADRQVYPSLLIRHGLTRQRQTFYNLLEDDYDTRIMPDMCNKRVIPTSSREWLLLADYDSEECFLWNSTSMEKIQLPSNWRISKTLCCFLTSSPRDDLQCKVILLMNELPVIFWFCRVGESMFKEVSYEIFLSSAAMYKGELYLLTIDYGLKRVNFTSQEGEIHALVGTNLIRLGFAYLITSSEEERKLKNTDISDLQVETVVDDEFRLKHVAVRNFRKDYLLESGEDLLMICRLGATPICTKLLEFFVYRMNFSDLKWEPLTSISPRTIFLSAYRSITCFPAHDNPPRVKGNSIYYAHAKDGRVFVYGLEDQSISSFLPCPNINRRHRSFLEWIVMV